MTLSPVNISAGPTHAYCKRTTGGNRIFIIEFGISIQLSDDTPPSSPSIYTPQSSLYDEKQPDDKTQADNKAQVDDETQSEGIASPDDETQLDIIPQSSTRYSLDASIPSDDVVIASSTKRVNDDDLGNAINGDSLFRPRKRLRFSNSNTTYSTEAASGSQDENEQCIKRPSWSFMSDDNNVLK